MTEPESVGTKPAIETPPLVEEGQAPVPAPHINLDHHINEDRQDKDPVLGQQEFIGTFVEDETPPEKILRVFSRKDIVRTIPVSVFLPMIYPDFEPWNFVFRLKMSQDAEERRQVYLALAPTEQTLKEDEHTLDELCDLLVATPTGFSDLKDDGNGPGSSFKNYVMNSDPVEQAMLYTIVRGASTLYWRKISPQEFRK